MWWGEHWFRFLTEQHAAPCVLPTMPFSNYCVAQYGVTPRLAAQFNPTTGCPIPSALGDSMAIYNNTILTPAANSMPTCKGIAGRCVMPGRIGIAIE